MLEAVLVLGNVRPYQTVCTRTAGHWILEMPESGFRHSTAERGDGRGVGVVFNMRLRLMYGEVSVGKGEGV